MKRHLWILTGLSLGVTGVTGRSAASAPPAVTSEEPDALAKRLFREQQYSGAAAEFERLWTERSVPKYLFNAAMAREMMGHELQAFVHLHAFLAVPGLPESEVAKAQDRVRTLKERTIRLRVRVSPADLPAGTLALNARRRGGLEASASVSEVRLEPATLAALAVPAAPGAYDLPLEVGLWELEFAGRGYEPGRTSVQATPGPAYPIVVKLGRPSDTVEVTTEFMPVGALAAGVEVVLQGPGPATRQRVEQSAVTWRLKPGAWTLEANARGYETVRRDFTAGAEPVRLQVELAKKWRDGRRLALGLGVAGGVLSVAGTVTLAVAGSNWEMKRDDFLLKGIPEPALRNNWVTGNAGAGMLGAGIGIGLGAVTSLARQQRRIWISEVSLGASIGIGSAVGYIFARRSFFQTRDEIWENWNNLHATPEASSELNRIHTESIASAILMGVGIGILTSGVSKAIRLQKLKFKPLKTSIVPTSSFHGPGILFTRAF